MSASSSLRRRLAAAILLLAVLCAAAGGLHHHEDLFGTLQGRLPGVPADRVFSSHSPLSKASHWHSGVRVKDDPCLACHSQRTAGLPADPCLEAPLTIGCRTIATLALAPVSVVALSNGSRAPPALL